MRSLDLPRVSACAKAILDRTEGHGVPDEAIDSALEEILITRQASEAAQQGLITAEETAKLLLAHLETLVERVSSKRLELCATDVADLRAALFGEPDGFPIPRV